MILLFVICNFASARPGAVQTRDGKRHQGELSFTNGAVQVSNEVKVASIPRAEISRVAFQPETVAAAPESKGEGLGLLGYYFANTNVLGPVQVRLDPVIDFDWGISEPIAGIGKDYFAIIWMGYLEAPASGEFTFHLAADENARLQIGPDFVVEASRREQQAQASGTLELEQGKRYPITLLYRDLIGAAKVRLAWAGPDTARSPIPADRLYPASFVTEHTANIESAQGLLATTFQKADFSGNTTTRVDRIIASTVASNATRWTGQIRADASEPYTFYIATDGPTRLRVNGKSVIDKSSQSGLAELKGITRLNAGEMYDIELETLAPHRLFWSSPSQAKCVIPQTHLLPFKKMPLSPLGVDRLLPAGVLLRNGSFVACRVESMEEDIVQCSRLLEGRKIPVHEIARIVCQPLPRTMAARVTTSRPGVLLANGDFVEGAFMGMEGNRVTVKSVLFGLRTYHTTQQVLAVIIREAEGPPPPCEIQLLDQSILFATGIELEGDGLVLNDELLAGLRISAENIHALHQK